METGRVSATHVLVEKRYGVRERLVACHMNLSHWTQNAFYLRNTGNLGGLVQRAFLFKNTRVRGSGSRVAIQVFRQDAGQAHFTWENTTISPRSAGMTYKFTIKMKAMRIFAREKTQRFRVGGSDVLIYSQNEGHAHFTWENTTISPRSAGVTCKFTFKMKATRILHEKAQRFLRGWSCAS